MCWLKGFWPWLSSLLFGGIIPRHFSKLHHTGATVLVPTNSFGDSSKDFLLFLLLLNLGLGSRVFPFVQGLPGVHRRSGVPANFSHQDRVSAAMGLRLLGLFNLRANLFGCSGGPGTGGSSITGQPCWAQVSSPLYQAPFHLPSCKMRKS